MLRASGSSPSGDSPRLISLAILLAVDGLWRLLDNYLYDEQKGVKSIVIFLYT